MSNNNQVSLAGEFAVLSQLFFRGFDASLTLGNTKSVDILVSNPANGRVYRIEVKTKTGLRSSTQKSQFGPTYGWQMHEKHEAISDTGLLYCFVLMDKVDDNLQSKIFVIPSKVVSDYVKAEHSWWRSRKKRKDITNRTFRLGTDDSFKYPVKTPLANKYQNNWRILG